MHRNTHAIQRFLWWVAGADAEKLSDPLMPRSQGLRYEAIGLAICAITVLAMGGWFHQGSLIFLSRAHTYPMAVALAGAFVSCNQGRQAQACGAQLGHDRGDVLGVLRSQRHVLWARARLETDLFGEPSAQVLFHCGHSISQG